MPHASLSQTILTIGNRNHPIIYKPRQKSLRLAERVVGKPYQNFRKQIGRQMC